jgi:branched-chain amino acid transport system permease protein
MFLQAFYNGLSSGCVYVLIALGLALIFSIMRILQFAHGEIYMLGAYIVYYLYSEAGVNFFVSLVMAGIAMGLVGIVLERILFRRLRHANMDVGLLAAIGLSLILQQAGVILFSSYNKWITAPPILSGVVQLGDGVISRLRLAMAIIGIILVVALVLVVRYTKIGRAMVAISQDSESASLQGININRISGLVMAIGCSLGAIAGGLMGTLLALTPFMGAFALTKGIAIIILGGIGSIPGTIVAGLIIGLVDGLVPLYANATIAAIVGFSLIILILLIKPTGLFGHD